MNDKQVQIWKVRMLFLTIKETMCKCNTVICTSIYCPVDLPRSPCFWLLIALTKITTRNFSYEPCSDMIWSSSIWTIKCRNKLMFYEYKCVGTWDSLFHQENIKIVNSFHIINKLVISL